MNPNHRLYPRYKDVKERLENYLEAEKATLTAQSYKVGSRSKQNAELQYIQNEIRRLRKERYALENAIAGRPTRITKQIIPRDL